MKRVLLLLLCPLFLAAQNRVHGDILIQLEQDATIETVANMIQRQTAIPVFGYESPAPRWRIYTLHLDPAMAEDAGEQLLTTVRAVNGVAIAQWNNIADDRTVTPNDTYWLEQRDMGLIKVSRAWENTTGGLTPAGDTIVVAVLERGMQKEHPDLVPNLYHNWAEVPDNNEDDDNNGYIDDFTGWDAGALKGDGNGSGGTHGTSVCGIIGAKGNDSLGVTGVNWNIKMLTVTNVRLDDEIIAAYYYAGEMRRLYNTSNRQKGAFVVATNASFGFDYDRPEDHPLWCPAFDSLGQLGVLGIAATINKGVNVDEVGDMPTNCTSQYLIAVTNLDASTGKRMNDAGYGPSSIDMGAPGFGTYTTVNRTITAGDTTWHGAFGGTSAACPHVTGTVGLLYSVTCAGFVADATTNPSACAKRVRDAILKNVVPEPTIDGLTTTGGRLEVPVIVDEIMKYCVGALGNLDIFDVYPNPVQNSLVVTYQTPNYDAHSFRIHNALGQLMFEENFIPSAFEEKIRYFDNLNGTGSVYDKAVQIANWPSGVYILTICQGKSCIGKKFVKN